MRSAIAIQACCLQRIDRLVGIKVPRKRCEEQDSAGATVNQEQRPPRPGSTDSHQRGMVVGGWSSPLLLLDQGCKFFDRPGLKCSSDRKHDIELA